jgi:putative MFS transporter
LADSGALPKITLEADGVEQITARLERLPLARIHKRARILVGSATFFNSVDVLALAYVLPVLTGAWGLSLEQVGFLISAGYAGQLLGAILCGWAAERIGRLATIVYAVAAFSLLSLFCMFSWGYWSLFVFRTLQGLGMGGEVPVAAVYMNELAPARKRGRFLLFYEWLYPMGRVVVALAGLAVITHWGWRYMFLIGGAPLFLAPVLRAMLPESPRWLASKGRMQQAKLAVDRMEGRLTLEDGPPPLAITGSVAPRQTDWRELFRGIYLRRTLVVWVLWFSVFWIVNALPNWIPTLFRTVFKSPLQVSLQYGLVVNTAGLAGCLAVACLIDRTGRRPWFTGALLLGGFTFLALWYIGSGSAVVVLLVASLGAMFINSLATTLYLYTGEVYPTRLRALGVSVATVWLRIASILGSSLIGITVHRYGLPAVFLQFAVLSIVAAVAAALFCVETKGRVLEEISP